MPTASDELRAKMKEYFGDSISEQGPMKFLFARGYRERNGVYYKKPSDDHIITEKERECLDFLVDEWDFAYDFVSQQED